MNTRANLKRNVLSSPVIRLALASLSTAFAVVIGCSGSSSPSGQQSCSPGSTVACTCGNDQTGTETCGSNDCHCGTTEDAGATVGDSGEPSGDGGHNGPPPSALYAACALQGSFGWPCSVADGGGLSAVLDPTDCTDPSYPYCFLGGQGSWCTAACTTATVATTCLVEDAGCAPRTGANATSCNARGYCK